MIGFQVSQLLTTMLAAYEGVSDLNFSVGRPPQVWRDGKLASVDIPGLPTLQPLHTETIAMSLMQGKRRYIAELVNQGAVDVPYTIPGVTRFRANIFFQRSSLTVVLRVVPEGIPTIDALHLPQELKLIADLENGLVLIAGPRGSGRSTTLAALIDEINQRKPYHILTLEDPIEFLHTHKRSTVNQREIGSDTPSLRRALKGAQRQATNVVLVGDLCNAEIMRFSLEAAESGLLVLAALDAGDAPRAIARFIASFPSSEERMIRLRFAEVFRFVISQQLVTQVGGGRKAVIEILGASPETRHCIVHDQGKPQCLTKIMKESIGMQSLDHELAALVQSGTITLVTALAHANDAAGLSRALQHLEQVDGQ